VNTKTPQTFDGCACKLGNGTAVIEIITLAGSASHAWAPIILQKKGRPIETEVPL
jgi:hypothetical protein